MDLAVYMRIEFWILVICSVIIPVFIALFLIRKRRISRFAIAFTGVFLILIASIDAILLQRLSLIAKSTPSLWDDRIFASEFSIALFVLPMTMAGIGVNLLSQLLHEHLIIAELEYERHKSESSPQMSKEVIS